MPAIFISYAGAERYALLHGKNNWEIRSYSKGADRGYVVIIGNRVVTE